MKKFLFISITALHTLHLSAQNVGIGVNNPQKRLSVRGSILIDQLNENAGLLDSAALLFGFPAQIGITGNRSNGTDGGSLDFWTNSTKRFSIAQNGNVGIGIAPSAFHHLNVGGNARFTGFINAESNLLVNGGAYIGIAPNAAYKLMVNGDGRFEGNATITGTINSNGINNNGLLSSETSHTDIRASIGGAIDANFRLRVYDGNSRFGGSVEATGNMTIGGSLDNTYKLRVIGGNSRFGGDVQVTGSLDAGSVAVTNTLTIGGNGSVRSNGNSSLRIGFDTEEINVFLNANASVSILANVAAFSGGANNIRVILSHISQDPTSVLSWSQIDVKVLSVDDVSNTCLLHLTNRGGNNGLLKGTVYLTSIAKD